MVQTRSPLQQAAGQVPSEVRPRAPGGPALTSGGPPPSAPRPPPPGPRTPPAAARSRSRGSPVPPAAAPPLRSAGRKRRAGSPITAGTRGTRSPRPPTKPRAPAAAAGGGRHLAAWRATAAPPPVRPRRAPFGPAVLPQPAESHLRSQPRLPVPGGWCSGGGTRAGRR